MFLVKIKKCIKIDFIIYLISVRYSICHDAAFRRKIHSNRKIEKFTALAVPNARQKVGIVADQPRQVAIAFKVIYKNLCEKC